jgi:hypothetical protein
MRGRQAWLGIACLAVLVVAGIAAAAPSAAGPRPHPTAATRTGGAATVLHRGRRLTRATLLKLPNAAGRGPGSSAGGGEDECEDLRSVFPYALRLTCCSSRPLR